MDVLDVPVVSRLEEVTKTLVDSAAGLVTDEIGISLPEVLDEGVLGEVCAVNVAGTGDDVMGLVVIGNDDVIRGLAVEVIVVGCVWDEVPCGCVVCSEVVVGTGLEESTDVGSWLVLVVCDDDVIVDDVLGIPLVVVVCALGVLLKVTGNP